MKVALIQMHSEADKAANLEQARRLIEQAVAEERPDLVALPETWTCMAPEIEAKRAAAEPVPGGEAYGMLQELAARHRIVVHGGSLLEQNGDGLHNTTVVFDRDGRSWPATARSTCSTSSPPMAASSANPRPSRPASGW